MLDSIAQPPVPPLEKRTPKVFGAEEIAKGITTHLKPALTFTRAEPNQIVFNGQTLHHWLSHFPLPFIGL